MKELPAWRRRAVITSDVTMIQRVDVDVDVDVGNVRISLGPVGSWFA